MVNKKLKRVFTRLGMKRIREKGEAIKMSEKITKIMIVSLVLVLISNLGFVSNNRISASGQSVENLNLYCKEIRATVKGEKKTKTYKSEFCRVKITDKLMEKEGKEELHENDQVIDITIPAQDSGKEKKFQCGLLGIQMVCADETGSSSKSRLDDSISVQIKLKVNYKIYNRDKGDFIGITKVTSKLVACNGSKTSYLSGGVSIVSNSIIIGQTGWYMGGHITQRKEQKLSAHACTWTYKPSGWKAVSLSTATLGANQTVKLKRGKHTWKVQLVNNLSVVDYS